MKYEYSSILPLLVFAYVFFPLLILCGIKKIHIKEKKEVNTFFDKDETTIIKGICIIIVMLTHYSTRAVNPSFLFYLWFSGYLAVAVFFLVSGYAMYMQFKKKGEAFFEGFIFHRCVRLIVPFFVVSTLMSLLNRVSIGKYLYNLVTLQIPKNNVETFGVTWFLVAMLYFSISFFLCFKYMSEKNAFIAILTLSTLYMIVCVVLNCGVWWYDTTYCFFIGIFFAKYKEQILSFYHKYKFIMIATSAIGVAALVLLMSKGWSENIIVLFVCGFFAISLVIAVFSTVTMKNPILKLIGEMSWEIFLLHSTTQLFIYGDEIYQKGYSIILIIGLVILLSYVVYCLDSRIMNITKK